MSISRRRFLGFLPSISSLFMGPTLEQQPPAPKIVPSKTMLNKFFVAGYQYYQGHTVIDKLKQGDPLTLAAEPDNPHDRYAVQIFLGQTKLGYVPRAENRHICRLLADNAELACEVEETDPTAASWGAIQVRISLIQQTLQNNT